MRSAEKAERQGFGCNRSEIAPHSYNASGISARDEHARGCQRARRRPPPGRKYDVKCGSVCNLGRYCSMTAIPACVWIQVTGQHVINDSHRHALKGFEDDEGFRPTIPKTCASSGYLLVGPAGDGTISFIGVAGGRGSLCARSQGRRSPTTLMSPIKATPWPQLPTGLALPSFGLILHCTQRLLSGPSFHGCMPPSREEPLFAQNRRTTS